MNLPCHYKGQRATFLGVDMNKKMYKVKTEDGHLHFVDRLCQINWNENPEQGELFKSA